jgi:serine protease AprX
MPLRLCRTNPALAIILLALAVTLPCLAVAEHAPMTPHLAARVAAAPQTQQTVWVYLSAETRDSHPIALTERALRRRARVDPNGYLIDSLDYPICADIIDQIAPLVDTLRRVSRWLRAVSVDASAQQLATLQQLPFVDSLGWLPTLVTTAPPVTLDAAPHRQAEPPTDPDYGNSLYQTRFCGVRQLHQIGLSGRGVLIALLDSGFEYQHEAFESLNLVAQYDFINDDHSVRGADCEEAFSNGWQDHHGTLVLGAIGAFLPGQLIGVAWGADYALAKTEIVCGGTEIRREEDNWLAAAEWADSLGADIVSSSLGYYAFQDETGYRFSDLDGNTALTTRAADWAAAKNILVVTSAGNTRNTTWNHITTPADADSCIAVGAALADSSLARFSSPGPTADGRIKPDITTLGGNVYTTRNIGGYALAGGTSLSAPLVAGGAALALEHDPTATAATLAHLIRQTGSMASNPNNDFGYGLYNAARAANIVRILPLAPINILLDETATFTIITEGWLDAPPSIYGVALPSGVTVSDNGDGTADLFVFGNRDMNLSERATIVADLGCFADTQWVDISLWVAGSGLVYAGPNPFADSVRIFVRPEAGLCRSVTIFSPSGEKVWEQVNSSATTADDITWYGTNRHGRQVAPGVYLVLVQTDHHTVRLKVLKSD